MDKKRQIVFPSNKAQVTVFIIIGIILLFVFIAIIAFTSQLQKQEFSDLEEQAFNQMFENMKVDKKSRDGILHLVLLKNIGEAFVTSDYSEKALKETIKDFLC